MNKLQIKVPIKIIKGIRKKKNYFLSLNQYRNWDKKGLEPTLKKDYKKIIYNLLDKETIEPFNKITATYQFYLPDKRKRDIPNFLSVIDKYLMDAVVEYGDIIEDDNYNFYPLGVYMYECIDDNKEGYVIVTIKEYTDEIKERIKEIIL